MQYNLNKYLFLLALLSCNPHLLLANELFKDTEIGAAYLLVDYRYYVYYSPLPIATLKEPDFVKQAVLKNLVQAHLVNPRVQITTSNKGKLVLKSLNTLSKLSNECNNHFLNTYLKKGYDEMAIEYMLKCLKKYNLSIDASDSPTTSGKQYIIYVEMREYIAHVGCVMMQLLPLTPGLAKMFVYKIYVLDVETQKIIWFNADFLAGGWTADINHKPKIESLFTKNLLDEKVQD